MADHSSWCNAPICMGSEEDQSSVVWIAGESICKSEPRNAIQLKQIRINDALSKGAKSLIDKSFTLEELRKSSL